jgi:hypothetical protein
MHALIPWSVDRRVEWEAEYCQKANLRFLCGRKGELFLPEVGRVSLFFLSESCWHSDVDNLLTISRAFSGSDFGLMRRLKRFFKQSIAR